MIVRRLLLVVVWLALAPAAFAHKASDGYLVLDSGAHGTTLRVDLALRDLDLVLDLDADGDARLTWGEVRAAWPAIDAYLAPRVQVAGCALRPAAHALETRSDGSYAAVTLVSDCRPDGEPVIVYTALREVDATHRGIARITPAGGHTVVRLLDPARPASLASAAAPAAHASFLAEGVLHIVTGYDHVLFLLCLLLPSVMRRTHQGWQPVATLREAIAPVAWIVSAFTLAHSTTLALAAAQWVVLPAWFVEPAIAATIVLAALDNLVPIFGGRRAAVAFGFGLIHGFGFAGVLGELNLPRAEFAWALLRFNLGLELGQLVIVALVATLLFVLRRYAAYPQWVIGAGSFAAIAIGSAWFVERTARLSLLPI